MLCSEINKIDHEVQTSLEYLSDQTRQHFEAELKRLREDKYLLEGKIKGYLTLSDICKEYKEELSTLRQEYNKLQDRINSMNSQPNSNESPTPDNGQRTGNGHEKDNGIIHHSSPHSSNIDVASSILNDLNEKQTPIKTRDLYGSTDDVRGNKESLKSMSHSHEYVDKYPMQESLAPESVTGLGFEKLDRSSDYAASLKPGYVQSGDLIKFSIQHQDEKQLEEIMKSVNIDNHYIPEMKKVIAVVKSFSDTENDKLKKANNILLTENKNLQAEKASLIKRIQLLQDQHTSKVRSVEEQIQNGLHLSSGKSPSTNNDWVHVSKSNQNSLLKKSIEPIQQNGVTSEEIQILKENNAQLTEANQRWSSEWNKLQQHYDTRISELQTERDKLTKDITDLKISEESRVKDYEKMLLNSKRRANEEESAKEEAFLQLNTANNKLEALQAQLARAEETISKLTREKQSIETENSVLRQRPGGMTSGVPMVNADMRSPSELKTENDVLRQQLLVFQEDFDRERSDRAQAQASKDEYKKQNEQLKKRARQVEQKNTSLERQVKTLDDANRRLNEENSSNLQEISRLKIQLQREREKIYTTNQNGWNPPIIQSAGLQQQQQHVRNQQYMFGQPVLPQQQQSPVPYRVPPTYNQARVPQLNNGVMNGYSENTGPHFQPTSPPENYFRTSQASKQTEFRAGAWTCGQCTYVNYPGRTVCEMCGYIQNPSNDQNTQNRSTGNNTLHSRGDHIHHQLPPQPQPQQFQQQAYGGFMATNRSP